MTTLRPDEDIEQVAREAGVPAAQAPAALAEPSGV
jgi:NACalpha-BTF3-like transcription factor